MTSETHSPTVKMNAHEPLQKWSRAVLFSFITIAYGAIRLELIPDQPQLTYGFRHDSAYLAIIARNLLAGKGFVLDALWLNFDNPHSLPMPYRNANPLFPILVAVAEKISGLSVASSAFAVSVVSSALLLVATYYLMRLFFQEAKAFGMACLIIVLPGLWSASWMALSDELWVALMVFSVAFLMRSDGVRSCALAGAFFGFAWLARSLAIMALPSAILFLLLRHGWKSGLRRATVFCALALVVALPWIVRNIELGNLSTDDNPKVEAIWAYYVSGGESAIKAFHSPNEPLPLSVLIRKYPLTIAKRALQGSRSLLKILVQSFSGGSRLGTLLFGVLVGLCITAPQCRGIFKSPQFAALLLYFALLFGLLSVVGRWTEPRYFIFLHVLVGAWVLWSVFQQKGRRFLMSWVLLLAFYLIVFRVAILNGRWIRSVDTGQASYFENAFSVASKTNFGPMVVGYYPYNYSFATGAQALAIPYSDDSYLVAFMNKYHACHIFLREDELGFFKPDWQIQPPSEFLLDVHRQGYYLFTLNLDKCRLSSF